MISPKKFRICKNRILIHGFLTITHFITVLGEFSENLKNRSFPQFGHPMLAEFLIKPGFIQVDHGSFGAVPRFVAKAMEKIQLQIEAHPALFYRRDHRAGLSKARQLLAQFMNWDDPEDIVMIPNTSSGLSTVLRSLKFQPGDRILYLSTVFRGTKKLINFVIDSYDGTISGLNFPINLPMSNENILTNFEKFLMDEATDSKSVIRIAVIDHISSMPSLIMPLQRILEILRHFNIITLVDGAQALGQVPVDLQLLKPDFYIADCHKWLFTARSCAVMYVDEKHQSWLHPTTISYYYRNPADFQYEFSWQGTHDLSPYLTVEHAQNFRNFIGGEKAIQRYNHRLCWKAGNLVAEIFRGNFKNHTEIVQIQQEEAQVGSMVDVRLPISDPKTLKLYGSSQLWDEIQFMSYKYLTYAPVYKFRGYLYVRLSCQIYNEISDYKKVAEHFLSMCQTINGKL